jgi:hypothetical protein
MAVGKLPWRGSSTEAIKAEIRLGVCPSLTGVDPRIIPLVKGMMHLEPSRRPALESLIETVAGWTGGTGTTLKNVLSVTGIRRSHTHLRYLTPRSSRSSFGGLPILLTEFEQGDHAIESERQND